MGRAAAVLLGGSVGLCVFLFLLSINSFRDTEKTWSKEDKGEEVTVVSPVDSSFTQGPRQSVLEERSSTFRPQARDPIVRSAVPPSTKAPDSPKPAAVLSAVPKSSQSSLSIIESTNNATRRVDVRTLLTGAWSTEVDTAKYKAIMDDQSCPTTSRLFTPTFIDYLFGHWFIVDCWNHRVVYSRALVHTTSAGRNGRAGGASMSGSSEEETILGLLAKGGGVASLGDRIVPDVRYWKNLDEGHESKHKGIKIPHSVATDGEVLLIESSVGGSSEKQGGRDHSVLVYKPKQGWEDPQQFSLEMDGGGGNAFDFVDEVVACTGGEVRRPHKLSYDPWTQAYYLYLTNPATLAKFVRKGPTVERVFCHSLPFMKGLYARSFALHQGYMYITAGPAVSKVDYKGATTKVAPKLAKSYNVKYFGFKKAAMNDLQFIDGWWYGTGTGCGIVRFKDIDNIGTQSLTKTLGMCREPNHANPRCSSGHPYFISKVGGTLFVPYIFGCSGILTFQQQQSPPPVLPSSSGSVGEGEGDKISRIAQLFTEGWKENSQDQRCRGIKW